MLEAKYWQENSVEAKNVPGAAGVSSVWFIKKLYLTTIYSVQVYRNYGLGQLFDDLNDHLEKESM